MVFLFGSLTVTSSEVNQHYVPGTGPPPLALFCITVNLGRRVWGAFLSTPASLSFGQHAVLCCPLPPAGGESENRGRIPGAEVPAGRGKVPPPLWPGPRRPRSLGRCWLSTLLRPGRLPCPPELSCASTVPGRLSRRPEAEVLAVLASESSR